MDLTIGNYSSSYFKTYSFNSSDKSKENAVDASKISKERYNVSNLTNALDSLNNNLSSFQVVTSVDLFSKNLYKMSQLYSYDKLAKKLENKNNTKFFLSGSTDLSEMYEMLGSASEMNVEYIESLIEKAKSQSTDTKSSKSIASNYSDYLSENETGSIIDIVA